MTVYALVARVCVTSRYMLRWTFIAFSGETIPFFAVCGRSIGCIHSRAGFLSFLPLPPCRLTDVASMPPTPRCCSFLFCPSSSYALRTSSGYDVYSCCVCRWLGVLDARHWPGIYRTFLPGKPSRWRFSRLPWLPSCYSHVIPHRGLRYTFRAVPVLALFGDGLVWWQRLFCLSSCFLCVPPSPTVLLLCTRDACLSPMFPARCMLRTPVCINTCRHAPTC